MNIPRPTPADADGGALAVRLFGGESELAALCRARDWDATPLGPIHAWSCSLRTVAAEVVAAPVPMSLLWGPALVQIYNDGYRALMGRRHPAGLGQPMRDCWPEAWHFDAPLLEGVLQRGESYAFDSQKLTIERDGAPEEAWFRLGYGPVRDDDGEIGGVLLTAVETTPLEKIRRTEEALHTSEERYRAFVAASSDVIFRMSPDWSAGEADSPDLLHYTPAPLEDWMARFIHPEDREPMRERIRQALATRSMFEFEHRVRRPDGSVRWVSSRALPIYDQQGRIVEWLGTAKDITARRQAEEALRLSEQRFRQFAEASPDVLWIRDAPSLRMEYLSPAFEQVYERPREQQLGEGVGEWSDLIHPDDRRAAMAAVERVRHGEPVRHEFRLQMPDGHTRWIENTDFPLLDASGRVQRIAGFAKDVTEQRETSARLNVLVSELQHRTRNLIAVIRSIADRTLASSTSLEDFGDRFRDRLAALARVNSLLSRLDEGQRICFDDLLRTELSGHGVGDGPGPRIRLSGPDGIPLRSSTIQTFALALHELATNALKYGGLSRPEGWLEVTWDVIDGPDGKPRLRVVWREGGVPLAPPSRRLGYGRELIERALPYQLGAQVTYRLDGEGVCCTITLPISERRPEPPHA